MPNLLKKSLILLAGSCTSFLAYWTVSTYLQRRKYRHIPGPPTRGIKGFYLGNAPEIIENLNNGGMFSDLLLKW